MNQNAGKSGATMQIPGAVERSMAPTPYSPRNAYLLDEQATFSWFDAQSKDGYVFTITDFGGSVVEEHTTSDTFVRVELTKMNLLPNECYYWQVANKRMPAVRSDEFCFRVFWPADYAAIRDSLGALKQEIDPATAVGQLILATFYRQKQITTDAMSAYGEPPSPWRGAKLPRTLHPNIWSK